MAEWLGTGLQNLLQRFDSAWYLKKPLDYIRRLFLSLIITFSHYFDYRGWFSSELIVIAL